MCKWRDTFVADTSTATATPPSGKLGLHVFLNTEHNVAIYNWHLSDK